MHLSFRPISKPEPVLKFLVKHVVLAACHDGTFADIFPKSWCIKVLPSVTVVCFEVIAYVIVCAAAGLEFRATP